MLYYAVSIFFGMAERFHMDKVRSKNLTGSLVLCFYSFFTMFLTLNPIDFWQFSLFIGLIIDDLKKIVNNLDRFVFWSTQIGTPIR